LFNTLSGICKDMGKLSQYSGTEINSRTLNPNSVRNQQGAAKQTKQNSQSQN
jgi:hypothetical protein